ncbi:MAG: response regulator [Gemmatimonadota bacterium]
MSGEALKKEKLLIQVLRKIPIFKGLSPTQVRKVLGLCQHRQHPPGAKVCQANSPSDEMYVLLSGELAVVTPEGLRVATILPVTTVGEMGVITGQPRSATVEVIRPSALLALQKGQFEAVLRQETDMQAKVFRAIIDVLAGKLNNDNIRLREHQMEKGRYEGRMAVLERKLEEQRQRTAIAIEMAAARSDQSVEEVELHIVDRVKDLVPRLLVVDDEAEFRALVKEALPAFEVLEAVSGKQALEIVEEAKLDLVITDIRMPEMDGLALLEALRARHPDLPVVATSGYLDREEVEGHGFDGFAGKPVSLAEFRDLVEDTMARRQG